MAHLTDIAAFVAVVEQGSFTAGARLLKLPPTTISRRVRLLEDQLGVRLLQRTTRSLALTGTGRRYFETCSSGLALIEDADRDAEGAQAEPSGVVRISAPVNFGAVFLADVVTDFLAKNPRVKAEMLLSDERLDLVKMRVDVALRTGALPDSGMVARKLGSAKRVFCASPAYLARRGTPETPADLKHHDCIVTGGSTDGTSWVFAGDGGNETVAVNGRFSANVMSFALTAAIAGLGIAQVPEGLALPDLKAGRLVPVLEPFVLDGGALYVVFPSSQHVSAAVRAFIDHVTAWAVSWPAREGTSAQH